VKEQNTKRKNDVTLSVFKDFMLFSVVNVRI